MGSPVSETMPDLLDFKDRSVFITGAAAGIGRAVAAAFAARGARLALLDRDPRIEECLTYHE